MRLLIHSTQGGGLITHSGSPPQADTTSRASYSVIVLPTELMAAIIIMREIQSICLRLLWVFERLYPAVRPNRAARDLSRQVSGDCSRLVM